jgi:hypothetical protein
MRLGDYMGSMGSTQSSSLQNDRSPQEVLQEHEPVFCCTTTAATANLLSASKEDL